MTQHTQGFHGIVGVLVLATGLGQAQTKVDLPTQSKRVDFSQAASTRSAKTGILLPSTCSVGDQFFKTDATPGANLYGCTTANVWTVQTGATVASVFGRTGAVAAVAGDYSAGLVANAAAINAANTFLAGSKQTFQPSGTTAAGRIVCAALPSAPVTGDLACDSADSNRLKIYDGVAWQSMVGGSGITMLTQVGDLKAVRDSATQVTVGSSCSSSAPCNVRVGDVTYTYTDSKAASGPSGSGTVRLGVDSSGVRTAWHNLIALTCTGWTCVSGVSVFPSDSVPIAQCTVSGGSFDATGCVDLRASYGRDLYTAGTGLVLSGNQFLINTASVQISAINAVTFSATPVFNAASGNLQTITLSANVTSATITNPNPAQSLTFKICQDATGGWTFTWPATVLGGMTISTTANKCSAQEFIYDGANWLAKSAGVANL